jgi:hypothetical protein
MPLSDVWRKSERSMSNGNCVQLRMINDQVHIQDSANPGPYLAFERIQFLRFLTGVVNREFDLD